MIPFIQHEFFWLQSLIRFRFKHPAISLRAFPSGVLNRNNSRAFFQLLEEAMNPSSADFDSKGYSDFIYRYQLSFFDRLLLLLTLTPQLMPKLLESEIFGKKDNPFLKKPSDEQISRMFLVQAASSQVYLPSGLTFVYLLDGESSPERELSLKDLHFKNSLLLRRGYIILEDNHPCEPLGSGVLWMPRELLLELISPRIWNNSKPTDQSFT